MACNPSSKLNVQVSRKTKVETTYEYVPILGEILGYWRKVNQNRIGHDIHIFVVGDICGYDRLFINGKEVALPKEK